jgi:arabinofuranosyltransferase
MLRDRQALSQNRNLFIALFVFCLAVCGLYWARELALTAEGFPLDDAWIYLQFARAGAAGHYGEFNLGEPVTGITGPLWALLLTPLHAVAGSHLTLLLALVKGLGVLLLFASCLLIYDLGNVVFGDRRAGVLAAFFLPLMPKVVWGALSGMESPLLVLLVLACLDGMARWRRPGWQRDIVIPLLIGLAGQTRPEANLLFVIFVIDQAIEWRRAGAGRRLGSLAWAVVRQGAIVALIMAPNALWSYSVAGQPLPNTFFAKTRGLDLAASLRFVALGSAMLWADPPAGAALRDLFVWPPQSAGMALALAYAGLKAALTVGLFAWGVRAAPERRRLWPALAWLAGDFLLYAVFFTRTNRHYFVPMLPSIALLCGGGLAALSRLRAGRLWPAAGAVLLFFAIGAVQWADEYAWNVKNINDQQVAIGRWVAQTLPADAVLAINDVGAIKYFSQRRVIDVTGLVTPAILPYTRAGRKLDYLRLARPDYLIVYDSWFPEARQWSGFQLVREFRLDYNTIAGGDVVRAYRVLSFPPAAE